MLTLPDLNEPEPIGIDPLLTRLIKPSHDPIFHGPEMDIYPT